MSKRRKEGVDWKGGSDALFRAVRSDHEANAADYARVEAELARRLAAGGFEKLEAEAPASAVTPARAFTLSALVKVSLGVLLLAAGYFALTRTVDFVPADGSRPESSLEFAPTPAATGVAALPLGASPDQTATEPAAELQAQQEGSAPAAPSRAALRNSTAPRHPSASHDAFAHSDSSLVDDSRERTPASVGARVTANANANERSREGAQTPARTNEWSGDGARKLAGVSVRSGDSAQSSASDGAREKAGETPEPSPRSDLSREQADAKAAARPRTVVAHESEAPPAAAEATSSSAQSQPRPSTVRVDDASDARAELALIERMQAAMRAAKPAAALALCAEHAKRWPRGVFAEEREAVSAIASCSLRADGAAARARRFLSAHPNAPTAPRVAAACAPLSAAPPAH